MFGIDNLAYLVTGRLFFLHMISNFINSGSVRRYLHQR